MGYALNIWKNVFSFHSFFPQTCVRETRAGLASRTPNPSGNKLLRFESAKRRVANPKAVRGRTAIRNIPKRCEGAPHSKISKAARDAPHSKLVAGFVADGFSAFVFVAFDVAEYVYGKSASKMCCPSGWIKSGSYLYNVKPYAFVLTKKVP